LDDLRSAHPHETLDYLRSILQLLRRIGTYVVHISKLLAEAETVHIIGQLWKNAERRKWKRNMMED
jgi:hypothetical protein